MAKLTGSGEVQVKSSLTDSEGIQSAFFSKIKGGQYSTQHFVIIIYNVVDLLT